MNSPQPHGVPVRTTSPGSSVKPREQNASSSATPKTISVVDESCTISPFTRVRSASACGSGISSAVTTTGPSGQKLSKLLPRTHWPSRELDVARGDVVGDRVAEDVVERVPPPTRRMRRPTTTASSTSQSTREVSAASSSIGSRRADHARRELREHERPLRALDARLADVVEVVEPDRDDLARPDRCTELAVDRLAQRQLARVDSGPQQGGQVSGRLEPPVAVALGHGEVLAAVDPYRRQPHRHQRTVAAWEPSRRRYAAGLGPDWPPRRARARARALPRDGDRPGAPRRPDHRRRLDVDGDDAVQPQPARARRPRWRRRGRGGRRPARLQHDRGLRQPVAGHARDARVADLARGDRRLDRADGARARLRRRSSAWSAATRRSRPR